jgi:deferrochelatase/peroxidase EfeB
MSSGLGPWPGRASVAGAFHPLHTMKRMPRTDIYIKVTVQHDREESPEKLAAEIIRQMKKIYVVRQAEMTNFVSRSEE